MEVYKLAVDLYVYADSVEEAEELIHEELKYLCKLDNQLTGFDYTNNSATRSEL